MSTETPAYQLPAAGVLEAMDANPRGLPKKEARARLDRGRPNEVAPEKRAPAWRKVLAQFQDVLVLLLLVATAISAAVLYLPFLQQAFSTVPLGDHDWLRCVAIASSVLWVREGSKLLWRARGMARRPAKALA